MQQLLTLLSPQLARQYYLQGTWQHDTLYSLLNDHARVRGQGYALRDGSTRLTWLELRDWVDSVAIHLHHAGLKGGDRVAVWLPNRVEAVVVLLACSRNGYVCNPSLHQNYTVAEIVEMLDRISCKALFAQPGYGADAKTVNVFEKVVGISSMREVFALPPGGVSRVDLHGAVPFPPRKTVGALPPKDTDPDKVVYLAFTSGTTGTPKGVMHSDNTLLANGRAMVQDWGHNAETVLLTLSPMSHHIGTVALEQSLVAGCELVMRDPSTGLSLLQWIEDFGATYVMGVPTHAMDVLAAMKAAGRKGLAKVKVFYMAGSPIPQETAEQFLAIGVTPQNVYGMTENGSHQYTRPRDNSATITSTCGKACDGFEVTLWNPESPDIEAQPGDVGEIASRGPLLMLGYFSNQAATESSFNSGGWFLSGDLGQFDEAGNLRIVGRKKDLIIRGGHNIHPARIEGLAHRHKGVAMAAAFAVEDERLGEQVCLAIIPTGDGVEADQLLEHLFEQGLSKFDMPEFFLRLNEFPMTPSGKILKRELMQWVRLGHYKPTPVRWSQKKAVS